VVYKATNNIDIQKIIQLFQEAELFNNCLIKFINDSDDFRKEISYKFGLMFKSWYDEKIYMLKFIFKREVMCIVSKIQKNDVDSFRFLEAIIDTILVALR